MFFLLRLPVGGEVVVICPLPCRRLPWLAVTVTTYNQHYEFFVSTRRSFVSGRNYDKRREARKLERTAWLRHAVLTTYTNNRHVTGLMLVGNENISKDRVLTRADKAEQTTGC